MNLSFCNELALMLCSEVANTYLLTFFYRTTIMMRSLQKYVGGKNRIIIAARCFLNRYLPGTTL